MIRIVGFVLTLLALPVFASAQESARRNTLGYPSVEAARADLQKRGARVLTVRHNAIWMSDQTEEKIWLFTRPGHPAHPAAFWATSLRSGAAPDSRIGSLCMGAPRICESLRRRVADAVEKRNSLVRAREATKDPNWKPTRQQLFDAVGLAERYFKSLETGKLKKAYSLLGAEMKSEMPYDAFRKQYAALKKQGGGDLVRTDKSIHWYLNTISLIVPGLYAGIVVKCRLPHQRHCTELLQLYEPPGGRFTIIRHETSFADPRTLDWNHGLWDRARSAMGVK